MTKIQWKNLSEQERFSILSAEDPNFYHLAPAAQAVVCQRVFACFERTA